jgi:Fe/S biogenesis protein NfuA
VSPLAPETGTEQASRTIVEVTPEAHRELVALRDTEADADRLGLRLEIVSGPARTSATTSASTSSRRRRSRTRSAPTGRGRVHAQGHRPAKDLDSLTGATLDHTSTQGLIIRNPNRPAPPRIEGLVRDDDLSAEIEALVAGEVNPASLRTAASSPTSATTARGRPT